LEKAGLVAAVPAVQGRWPARRFKHQHDGARAVVGWDARDLAAQEGEGCADMNLPDVAAADLQRTEMVPRLQKHDFDILEV
jgi:uncharacterized membrane protein YgcG